MDVAEALSLLARGPVDELDGRGVNRSFRVAARTGSVSVKVHCPEESTRAVRKRIEVVDSLLRGRAWYPPLVDLGQDADGHLVVLREFVEGRPADLSPEIVTMLAGVLGELAAVTPRRVDDALVHDYATAWLTDPDPAGLLCDLTGRPELSTLRDRLPVLLAGGRRITGAGAGVCHGDLHVRNLVRAGRGPVLIDWDEAALSRRPADAAKALWLVPRVARGGFALDAAMLGRWLDAAARLPGATRQTLADLPLLGAIWFLPRRRHVELLGRRHPEHIEWYLGWIGGFWSRFDRNLGMITAATEQLSMPVSDAD